MFLSKYGVARHIYIPIVKRAVVDFAVSADWTPSAGDVKISKDGGAAANVTNLPTAITMGNGAIWDFSLTATEMQAAQIIVTVVDSATKAVEDQSFIIETYGNASGQHAVDLADTVRAGLTALPNVASGSAGAIPTTGTGSNQISVSSGQVILQAGTGTGQLDFTSGIVKANVAQLLGTAWLTPAVAGTPDVNAKQFGGAPVTATTSVTIPASSTLATTTGAVGSVTGSVGGNVTGSVGSVATGGITSSSFAAGAINAAAIATDAIGSAELAASAVTEIVSAIWQDTTSGDFTAANSIGKSIMNGVALGTGLTVAAVSGAVGSVAGDVGGNIVGSVGSVAAGGIAASSFAAGAIDATAIAADAIGSSELATSAVNEIRDAILSDSTSFAGASIAAIKAKTDSLTFTVANQIDANIQYVNDVQVNGTGAPGNEWGP